MSKYRTDETEFSCQEHLVKALADQGYTTVEVHEQAQHLYGYHGDVRPEVAHIIVRRKFVGHAANDLGFVRGENGKYQAIISAYDRGKHNAAWMENLKASYGESAVIQQAAKQGLRFVGREKQGERIQLRFAKLGGK